MPKPRPEKTLTDYVAIAISPVLIMLLVGSLTFFLAEVLARKAASTTFHWILFWYTFATVLIARIGIEQGKGYAAGYGLALAGVTSLVLFKLAGSAALVGLILLAVAWWATNKLVWDCTLIDEREDASGEGLLQKAGLDRASSESEDASFRGAKGDEAANGDERPKRFWQRWLDRFTDAPLEEDNSPRKEPHAPGLWVVYFSLAALPMFGLGQLMLPADQRGYAFKLLWVYVAAGLALLVTTSFLGLRRYLRQRKLEMPASVTTAWLATGGGLILVIMLLCLLIPRPEADYSLTKLVDKLAVKVQKASDYALLKGEAGEGDGNRIGEREDDIDEGQGGGNAGKEDEKGGGGGKKNPGGQGDGKGKKGAGKKRGKGQAAKGKGGKQDQKANGQAKQNDRNAARGDGSTDSGDNKSSQSSSSSPASWVGSTFKTIIYVLLAIAAVFLIIKYRDQIAAGIGRFLADLRNLFGRKQKPAGASGGSDDGEPGEVKPQPRPFASFADPFATGSAGQMSTESVIAYTFEAMEAWAYERGIRRKYEQTPLEFTREIAEEAPGFAEDAMRLARLYTRANYADRPPSDRCREVLAQTWRAMQRVA